LKAAFPFFASAFRQGGRHLLANLFCSLFTVAMLFPQVLGQLLDWRFAQRANAMFAVSQRHANIRLNSSESNSRMRLSDCRGPYIEVPPQRRGSVHSSQIDFFSPILYTKMFAINFSTRCKKRFENGHVWEELDRFSKTHYGGTSGTLAKP